MYYPKFYFKLNYIEYFCYNRKSQIRKNCKYSIERLRDDIPKMLAQVKKLTILSYYNSCFKKIDLYKEKKQYKKGEQKKLTSHKKTQAANDNK